MNQRTPLADRPGMGALPIGTEGETFGQLQQAVRDAREAYAACSDSRALAGFADRLADAQAALRAAYSSVGLPYQPA